MKPDDFANVTRKKSKQQLSYQASGVAGKTIGVLQGADTGMWLEINFRRTKEYLFF